LILQPDTTVEKLRVVNVQGFGSVQNYDYVVALGSDLVVIPLGRNELESALGLGRPDDFQICTS
jgi:hypothetical protein